MTREELKSLPHLKVVEENTTTLHIHTEDGYTLYNYSKEVYEEEGEEKIHCELNDSNCYYFPIYEEYPKYSITTQEECDKMREEFEKMSDEDKLEVVDKYLGS